MNRALKKSYHPDFCVECGVSLDGSPINLRVQRGSKLLPFSHSSKSVTIKLDKDQLFTRIVTRANMPWFHKDGSLFKYGDNYSEYPQKYRGTLTGSEYLFCPDCNEFIGIYNKRINKGKLIIKEKYEQQV